MRFANMSIRKKLDKAGISMKELAEEIGIHYVTLSVWMGRELNDDEKSRIAEGLEKLIKKKKG